MNKIYIALATDKNYAQHAAVAMVSVLVNSKEPKNIQFFIIDDNIDNENKNKMRLSVEKFGSSIEFIKVKEKTLDNVFVSGNLTKAAYLRLTIPDILSSAIKKVIYLDCDLLVLDDIRKLWNIDMQSKPVAAAEDYGILSSSGKCSEKNTNLDWKKEYSYFNSGVLILDLQEWRRNGYSQKLVDLVLSRNFRHHDQDALNFLFMKNWCPIPLRWNIIPPIFNMTFNVMINKNFFRKSLVALQNKGIVHYAGGYKPWEYSEYKGFNDNYYKYLSLTAYKDVIMPQPNLKKKNHSIQRQLWRLKWADLILKYFS